MTGSLECRATTPSAIAATSSVCAGRLEQVPAAEARPPLGDRHASTRARARRCQAASLADDIVAHTSVAISTNRCAAGSSVRPLAPGDADVPRRQRREHVAHDDPRVARVDRQVRPDGVAHAGADHRLDRRVVVRAEHVARIDAEGAQVGLERVLAATARLLADQREVGDVAGDDGRRDLQRRRGDQEERVGAQQAVLDALELVELRADGERQVQLAGVQRDHDLVEVVVLDAADVELGRLGQDPPDDRRQDLHRDALERADHQSAAAGEERLDVALGRLQLLEHRDGVREERRPDGGELDAPRPAGAVEDLVTEHALEPGDLLADARLAEAEPVRSAPEGPLGSHGLQRLEVADLDVVEVDRIHK